MNRVFLVYNPASGDGHIKNNLSLMCDFFTKNHCEVIVHPTQAPLDGMKQIESRGREYDRIVVCGGDGMLHEGLNGWIRAKTDAILCYIPSGTINDFANTHGISKEILKACEVAVYGQEEWIDIGRFNTEYFTYVAAFGFATAIAYDTPHSIKKRLGPLAYILKAMEVVDFAHWENNCVNTKITWEDGEAEGDFLYGMVSNSQYVGSIEAYINKLFDWKDGILEGFFVRRPMNIPELNSILASLAKKDFSNPLIIQVQSPWFEFNGERIDWTLDGEFGGSVTQAKINVVKEALKISLP